MISSFPPGRQYSQAEPFSNNLSAKRFALANHGFLIPFDPASLAAAPNEARERSQCNHDSGEVQPCLPFLPSLACILLRVVALAYPQFAAVKLQLGIGLKRYHKTSSRHASLAALDLCMQAMSCVIRLSCQLILIFMAFALKTGISQHHAGDVPLDNQKGMLCGIDVDMASSSDNFRWICSTFMYILSVY